MSAVPCICCVSEPSALLRREYHDACELELDRQNTQHHWVASLRPYHTYLEEEARQGSRRAEAGVLHNLQNSAAIAHISIRRLWRRIAAACTQQHSELSRGFQQTRNTP